MMSLSAIRDESARQAKRAAKLHKKPYLFEEEDRNTFPPFPFPNLGDYRPNGYELINTIFCNSSGFSVPGEPALTVRQLIKRLKPGFSYAIIEEGEFQLYIGEFKQI